MKLGLIGKGTVGTAVYEGLLYLGHNMSFFDPAYQGSKLSDVLDTECVFICVPTDMASNGDCDTSIVEKVVNCVVCPVADGFSAGDKVEGAHAWRDADIGSWGCVFCCRCPSVDMVVDAAERYLRMHCLSM